MNSELEQRVARLEEVVEDLRGHVSNEGIRLRELGLRSGSKGVMAAFSLVAGMFVVNALWQIEGIQVDLFPVGFLYFVGLAIVGLLFYFAYIFGYNLLLDAQARRLSASRGDSSNQAQTTTRSTQDPASTGAQSRG